MLSLPASHTSNPAALTFTFSNVNRAYELLLDFVYKRRHWTLGSVDPSINELFDQYTEINKKQLLLTENYMRAALAFLSRYTSLLDHRSAIGSKTEFIKLKLKRQQAGDKLAKHYWVIHRIFFSFISKHTNRLTTHPKSLQEIHTTLLKTDRWIQAHNDIALPFERVNIYPNQSEEE
jgi:hypothetical protein